MRHGQTISKRLSHTRAWRLGNSNHTVRTRGVGGEDGTRERELIVPQTSLSCLALRNSVERGYNRCVPRSRIPELMGILSFSHYERSSFSISRGPTCFCEDDGQGYRTLCSGLLIHDQCIVGISDGFKGPGSLTTISCMRTLAPCPRQLFSVRV